MIETPLARKTLQHLSQYQVPGDDLLDTKKLVESVSLGRVSAAKEIDPDAGIDQYHLSDLIASRSPCHGSLPRNRRSSSCLRRRTIVLRPNSTASRLVFRPVRRSVSFINFSSMTMFVRMMCIRAVIHTHYMVRSVFW